MKSAILRRLLALVPTAVLGSLIIFAIVHLTPGGPAAAVAGPDAGPEVIARINREMGLDRPLIVQFGTWIWNLMHGDFGRSLIDGSPVTSHILQRLPNTLELTVTSILLGVLISIPLGVVGALRRGSAIDNFLTFLSVAGVSIPQFWLGLLMILVFSVSFHAWGLPWLPSSGAQSPFGGGDPVDRLTHLVMPTVVLAFFYIAVWSRFTRSSMLEVLAQDYVRTARAKGMPGRRVTYVHALRNAIIPLVTLVGLELPGLVSGGAIVEIVFTWPGLGRLLLQSSLQFDYTMVLGVVTFAALLVVAGNLLADVLYALLDPRIHYT
jgi:peptide/nickel transport system permease protein